MMPLMIAVIYDLLVIEPPSDFARWQPSAQQRFWQEKRLICRIWEWHPASKHAMHDVGDNFYIAGHPDFTSNSDYLGHVIREGRERSSNAALACFRGIAMPVVATRDIQAGEEILL